MVHILVVVILYYLHTLTTYSGSEALPKLDNSGRLVRGDNRDEHPFNPFCHSKWIACMESPSVFKRRAPTKYECDEEIYDKYSCAKPKSKYLKTETGYALRHDFDEDLDDRNNPWEKKPLPKSVLKNKVNINKPHDVNNAAESKPLRTNPAMVEKTFDRIHRRNKTTRRKEEIYIKEVIYSVEVESGHNFNSSNITNIKSVTQNPQKDLIEEEVIEIKTAEKVMGEMKKVLKTVSQTRQNNKK